MEHSPPNASESEPSTVAAVHYQKASFKKLSTTKKPKQPGTEMTHIVLIIVVASLMVFSMVMQNNLAFTSVFAFFCSIVSRILPLPGKQG